MSLKVLFIIPEIRIDGKPWHFPFWAGILAAIVEQKGGNVGILDLNALRMEYGSATIPREKIEQEICSDTWDIIGIGGLTSTYGRIKELVQLIKKSSPNSKIVSC